MMTSCSWWWFLKVSILSTWHMLGEHFFNLHSIKNKSCHLLTLNPELFLKKVNANGFLVAFGERATAISKQKQKILNIEALLLKAMSEEQKNIDALVLERNTSGSCSTFPQPRCPRLAPAFCCYFKQMNNETSMMGTPSKRTLVKHLWGHPSGRHCRYVYEDTRRKTIELHLWGHRNRDYFRVHPAGGHWGHPAKTYPYHPPLCKLHLPESSLSNEQDKKLLFSVFFVAVWSCWD